MTTLADEYAARCAADSDIAAHLPELYETVLRYPTARVIELGVRQGNSTAALLAAVEKVDGHLWSVDIAEPDVPRVIRDSECWTFTQGDDVGVQMTFRLPEPIDVLFIDTSHEYHHTLRELRGYAVGVVLGGTILCHDTEWTYEHGAPPDGPPFPVAAALDTYCEETGMHWTNRTGCYGLGVLVR